jgi:hypothetical protein
LETILPEEKRYQIACLITCLEWRALHFVRDTSHTGWLHWAVVLWRLISQRVDRNVGDRLAIVKYLHSLSVANATDYNCIEIPLTKDVHHFTLTTRVSHDQHSFL